MNNDESMALMIAKRTAINAAINGQNEYVQQVAAGNWTSNTVKANAMNAVKANALIAGADISAWDGTAAPDPE